MFIETLKKHPWNQKKVRTTEENHTYEAFYCPAHDDYLKNSDKTVDFYKDSNLFNSAATYETFHIEKTTWYCSTKLPQFYPTVYNIQNTKFLLYDQTHYSRHDKQTLKNIRPITLFMEDNFENKMFF